MSEDEEQDANEDDGKAASITLPSPKRLAEWFAANGFDVEIVLTRNGKLSDDATDPGADPGPINDPIDEKEEASLRGLLAAYDVQDKEPAGEHGGVGPDEDDAPANK